MNYASNFTGPWKNHYRNGKCKKRKESIFIDLGVQQIQNHKKCLQVKVDIPAAINKKPAEIPWFEEKKIHWMTLRPTVKYGGGSIMDWDIFTSKATIKAQL